MTCEYPTSRDNQNVGRLSPNPYRSCRARNPVVVGALILKAILDNGHVNTLFPPLMLPSGACQAVFVAMQSQ